MSQSWGCCSNVEADDGQYIKCVGCNLSYHLDCLNTSGINKIPKLPHIWKCPACVNSAPKTSKQDSTPVRSVTNTRQPKRPALNSPPETTAVTSHEIRAIVEDVIKTEFSSMVEKMNANMMTIINQQLGPVKQAMQDIHESMSFMNARFEDLECEQAEAKKTSNDLQEENRKMRTEVTELNSRLNYLEQQVRASNLELQCVPENKQENLFSIVNNLAATVGCPLTDNSIMQCTRIAKAQPESARPRSIVVQLSSPKARNELLAKTIAFNKENPQDKLNSLHLGLTCAKTPVYLVEHLSPANKILHAAARKKAKESGYKYVWVRDGKIYARKADDSEYIFIRNMDSISKIK